MSSFLSNKLLQYRGQLRESRTIDQDLFCATCGYNVRGLNLGRNCPECGQTIMPSVMHDVLLSGEPSHRRRNWMGLSLIAACLVAAAAARFLIFIALVFAGWYQAQDFYLWFGTALGGMWMAGTWLLTTSSFNSRYVRTKWIRVASRCLSLAWLPAYFLWMQSLSVTAVGTPSGEAMYAWSLVLRGAGALGGFLLGIWLLQLANDAEIEDASRRIHHAIWLLPIPTLLLAAVPDQVSWISLFLIGPIMLLWCWYLFMMGHGVVAMQRHVAWAIRLAEDSPQRDERMRQTRRALETHAATIIRPVPVTPLEDLPLDQ